MKKIAVVLFVVATALAACGKKKDAATTPTTPTTGSDMGSGAMGSGDMGSGDMGSGAGSAAM